MKSLELGDFIRFFENFDWQNSRLPEKESVCFNKQLLEGFFVHVNFSTLPR